MWNEICSQVFSKSVERFKENNIRYFVLRNYQNLPEQNIGKDVDIIVEPNKLKEAKKILKNVYAENNLVYYDEAVFDKLNCMHGMGVDNQTGIHIDLIGGYYVKGHQIYTFDELYQHTKWYHGFCVLDEFFDGIMLLVYKQFGYSKPKLKQSYRDTISSAYAKYTQQFETEIARITSEHLAAKICQCIKENDYDKLIGYSPELNKQLRAYARRKSFIINLAGKCRYIWQRIDRVVLRYRKYTRNFAVLAPDGTGKTTFLDALIKELNAYYVSGENDGKFHVYHFRPNILPNLGALGEKAGVMEQDKDWTNPHRGKPANPISSLLRIAYYTFDYIIGWQKCVRSDVHHDRFSIFDRYSYDLIIDPIRTKLGLPKWIRKFFVRITPQPKIVFVLDADPEVIYARKQELSKEEINRQIGEYRKLANSHKRFRVINAEQLPEQMAKQALKIILEQYTEYLGGEI